VAESSIRLDLTGPWEASGAGIGLSSGDALLVEGLRSGEEWAYEALIEHFEHPVFNLVARLLNDPDDACDVVQEVFLKVFRNIGAFRSQSSLRTWIYRIAVNEAYNYRRWFGRRRGHEIGLEDEPFEGMSYEQALPDPGRSPYEITLDHQMHERLEQALGMLKPAFRSAVVLRDVEGLSYEEIAEVLELNLGTVKSRILRGREALRGLLQDREETRLALAPQAADSV
jgi:RNA polymerase sigma-70 factor (ECF subfamily)